MALYRVDFVDYGDHVYPTEYLQHDDDESAIEAAHRMNVPSIGVGFDLRDDERLVHTETDGRHLHAGCARRWGGRQ
jgi:hypothetical protein